MRLSECHELRFKASARNPQPSDCDGESEAPGPGATGIEIKHPVSFFGPGLVGMAADDRVESGRHGVEIEVAHVVEDIEIDFPELHDIVGREGLGPIPVVDVASDRADRRDALERIENLRCPNVSRMNDELALRKRL